MLGLASSGGANIEAITSYRVQLLQLGLDAPCKGESIYGRFPLFISARRALAMLIGSGCDNRTFAAP